MEVNGAKQLLGFNRSLK